MRTHYSSQSQLTFVRHGDIQAVHHELSYFMWESSTGMISRLGLPTYDDVREWITVLSHRHDSSTLDVQWCITDCKDYINGTDTAFDFRWNSM